MSRVNRFYRGSKVAFFIALFWVSAFAWAWSVIPYVRFTSRDPLTARRRAQSLCAGFFRWFLGLLDRHGLYRCRYEGAELPQGPCVMVANHPSLLDVTAIMSRFERVCCVVKPELIHNGLVGRLLRSCGHVAAAEQGDFVGGETVSELEQRLREGFPVLIFPEGTRSPKGGLHRFRRGAFKLAKKAQVPVVPLLLRCEPSALGKGDSVWAHPSACPVLTVEVNAPREIAGGKARALCGEVETEFRERLGLGPAPKAAAWTGETA